YSLIDKLKVGLNIVFLLPALNASLIPSLSHELNDLFATAEFGHVTEDAASHQASPTDTTPAMYQSIPSTGSQVFIHNRLDNLFMKLFHILIRDCHLYHRVLDQFDSQSFT